MLGGPHHQRLFVDPLDLGHLVAHLDVTVRHGDALVPTHRHLALGLSDRVRTDERRQVGDELLVAGRLGVQPAGDLLDLGDDPLDLRIVGGDVLGDPALCVLDGPECYPEGRSIDDGLLHQTRAPSASTSNTGAQTRGAFTLSGYCAPCPLADSSSTFTGQARMWV